MSDNEDIEQPPIIRQVILRPARLNLEMAHLQQQQQQEVPQVQAQPFAGYPIGFHTSLLSEIPQYHGNPSELSEYIRAVEDIFNQFNTVAYINKLLLSSARNRLKGAALEVVTGQNYNSWDELTSKHLPQLCRTKEKGGNYKFWEFFVFTFPYP